ncbi:proline-rich receptor-like protein kinase PERK9 [Hevea brasiliensis]|uniref:proline-rich receptor-like protein kinase PERK9 n=1 Tax=Hevea brasiliensis TaxID=3981 RepID=UPI0025E292A4|nr:proline-rich receptor-like protein kinase PERK9 [Hevea brasiliensis]
MWSSHKPKLSGLRHSVKSKMGIPSSLPTNPNLTRSPLPQSPPPQTPPLPQSPPPPSPPPPQAKYRLSFRLLPSRAIKSHKMKHQFRHPFPELRRPKQKQKAKQKGRSRLKETPVEKAAVPSVPFDLNSPPQSSEPVSKRTRSSSQTPAPAVQTPVTQSPLHSPAPASSADTIEEEGDTILDIVGLWDLFLLWCMKERKQGIIYKRHNVVLHMDVCEKIGHTYTLL